MKRNLIFCLVLFGSINIYSQKEVINNDLQIGTTTDQGYGKRLYFGDYGDNMDQIYFVRNNVISDKSELLLNIGDDNNDKFIIGRCFWDETEFTPRFVFQTDGCMGIGVNDPKYPLDVNGTIRAKKLELDGDMVISKNQSLFIGNASSLDSCFRITYYGDQTPGDTYFDYSENLFFRNGNRNNGYPIITFSHNSNVGIGMIDPQNKLDVNGTIRAKEIKVESNWADFVFKKGYNLLTLGEVEQHIKDNGTLPGVPSEKEVKTNGINVGEVNALLLQKIEELTLYAIKQQKLIEEMQVEMNELKKQVYE